MLDTQSSHPVPPLGFYPPDHHRDGMLSIPSIPASVPHARNGPDPTGPSYAKAFQPEQPPSRPPALLTSGTYPPIPPRDMESRPIPESAPKAQPGIPTSNLPGVSRHPVPVHHPDGLRVTSSSHEERIAQAGSEWNPHKMTGHTNEYRFPACTTIRSGCGSAAASPRYPVPAACVRPHPLPNPNGPSNNVATSTRRPASPKPPILPVQYPRCCHIHGPPASFPPQGSG